MFAKGMVFFRFRTPAGQVKINQTDHQPEAVHSDLHDLMIARSFFSVHIPIGPISIVST